MVGRHAALSMYLAFLTITSMGRSSEDVGLMPKFTENVPNITVTVGRDALLPCTVEQLKGFKVAWVQVDTQTILTIHKQVITRNPRVALLHNDHRTWHLQIKNVREIDRGWYMCQVNTDPMRSRQGYIDVVVPPDIIDRESSGDLTVREGQDVTLSCRAKGHPTPSIIWRREDNQDIVLDSATAGYSVGVDEVLLAQQRSGERRGSYRGAGVGVVSPGGGSAREVQGETLILKKVSRLQMGSYLCIASNGIPPSISKRTHLSVQFPPMTWVPQQLEGAYVGQDLTIECHTEAFPKSINYWTNERGDMIVAGERFEPVLAESSYKMYMKLRIRKIQPKDFGAYNCVAKNSLGETDGAIRVYDITPPISSVHETSKEVTEEHPGEPHQTSTKHKKEHTKYQNFLHPKGINDLTGQQHRSKPYEPKDQMGPETSHGQLPSYPTHEGGGACPHASIALLFLLEATTTALAHNLILTANPIWELL